MRAVLFAKLYVDTQMTSVVCATLWPAFRSISPRVAARKPFIATWTIAGIILVPSFVFPATAFLFEFGVTYAWLALQKHIHRPARSVPSAKWCVRDRAATLALGRPIGPPPVDGERRPGARHRLVLLAFQ
jgi:hypothetical protein